MEHIKNITKKSMVMLIALCVLLSSPLTALAGSGIGGSGGNVQIEYTKYTIAIKYIDDEGNELQTSQSATLTGCGKTYTAAVPEIDKYVYVGYYIEGDGNLTNLKKGDPAVTSKADGSDSKNGKGSYTLNVVYSVDKNDNKIPDKDEHYVITEKFEDRDGNSLPNVADKTVAVDGAVEYFGVVPSIPGYKYVGYYFKADHMTHEGGSLANLLTGDPYILLNSIDGIGTYVNHMVFEYDDDQYGRVNYDKNASDATGTMEEQKDLLGNEITLSANQFIRPGYLFAGWSTSPSGDVVEYADTAKFMLTQKTTTLYVVWEYDENQWATVSYDKNADTAIGTMEQQKVLKNSELTLNPNQFTREDYLFLGWSTTPDGTVEYTNKQVITLSNNMTLYAVWGTSELYYSIDADRDTAEVGDTIGYTIVFGNADILHSQTLYNAVATIILDDEIAHVNDSIKFTLNGKTVTVPYSYEGQQITVNLGTVNPRDEYVMTFNGVAVAKGEGSEGSVHLWVSGSLTQNLKSARSLSPENTIDMEGTGAGVTVVPSE